MTTDSMSLGVRAARALASPWLTGAVLVLVLAVASGCGDDGGGDGLGSLPILCGRDGDAPCAAGTTCVRGACLADCGGDPTVFDDAVADGVAFLANVCRTATALDAAPDVTRDVWELSLSDDASPVATIGRFEIDDGAPTVDEVAVATLMPAQDLSFFPSGYVAPAPDGSRVAIGYTQGDLGDVGELVLVPADPEGEAVAIPAPGNFDATWLGDDVLLLNGRGLGEVDPGGQGLYAHDAAADRQVRVLTNAGEFSGSVAVTGDGLVLYGSLDATFASRLTFADPGVVEAAIADGTALDVAAGPDGVVTVPAESAFAYLPGLGALVVTRFDETFNTRLAVRTFAGDGAAEAAASLADAVPLAEPVDGATVVSGALPGSGDRALLRHAGGLLLVSLGAIVPE